MEVIKRIIKIIIRKINNLISYFYHYRMGVKCLKEIMEKRHTY